MKPLMELADKAKVVLLSKSKQLEVTKVENDREFPIEVSFAEDREEKIATFASGEDIEVPDDATEAVTRQIKDATAPEKTDDDCPECGREGLRHPAPRGQDRSGPGRYFIPVSAGADQFAPGGAGGAPGPQAP